MFLGFFNRQEKGKGMHPIFKISAKISPIFRKRRIRRFLDTFKPDKDTRILDVGGLPRFWLDVPIPSQITLLNIHGLDDYEASFMTPNQKSVVGNGTQLPYDNHEFDIVFSNSVIEHVGTDRNQSLFAQEIRRVGKSYWVQTPAKEFFIEPHYFTLFLHWSSKPVQKRLLRNFSLWGLLGRPTEATLDFVLAELRLMKRSEMNALFPDAEIWVERCMGLPKSYTAIKRELTGRIEAKPFRKLRFGGQRRAKPLLKFP
jgi:hypothetical protein